MHQKPIIHPPPLTNAEIVKTLTDIEDLMRFRLCMSEIIPIEMSQYRIGICLTLLFLFGWVTLTI